MSEVLELLNGLDVLDHAPMGICIFDPSYKIVFWNTCLEEWTGLSREDLVGADVTDHFAHFGEPRYRIRLDAVFAGGTPAVFSSQLHKHVFPAPLPDGEFRIQHTTVTPLPSVQDGLHQALIVVEDVTELTRRIRDYRRMRNQALREMERREQAEQEQMRLEARIRQAEKVRSLNVMAGAVAHHFNNLLMAVLGFMELASETLSPDSPAWSHLRDADRAAKRAAELSKLMLTYVGQARTKNVPIDLAGLIEEAKARPWMAASPPMTQTYRLSANLPPLMGDPDQIERVLRNLVENSREALGKGPGEIIVATGSMHCDRDYLSQTYLDEGLPEGVYDYLEVSDTGCGMDEETVRNLFDPFFTTKFVGRGMGLAIVLGIVRGHHGGIWVRSAPGEGSTFRILFPAAGTIPLKTLSQR